MFLSIYIYIYDRRVGARVCGFFPYLVIQYEKLAECNHDIVQLQFFLLPL